MISTHFCPVCGAANNDTQTHCFACGELLPVDAQEEPVQQGTLLHERYRLGTTLGSGGYSAVYRGWDMQEGGRAVAIKQIILHGLGTEETIEATNTYNREVDALSVLSHPQVPRLYDHFSDQDHWYLVLEYIEGQTLERYLEMREAQSKPFQLDEVLGIGLQLCAVLTYLHSIHPPLIFRDLKPDNIMRTPSGRLYLIDFGIARRYTPGQSRDTQSLGSPGYAAPEQYGSAQTDARTDLYGLGALLHQLLSGKDPSETPRGLSPLHVHGQMGSVEMERLVTRLLASDPLARPASTRDVIRELEHIRQLRANAPDGKRIWQPPVPQNYPIPVGPQIQVQQMGQAVSQQPQRGRLTRRRVMVGIGAGATMALLLGGVGAYAFTLANSLPVPVPNDLASYTYTGHTDTVNSLSWSPTSQMLVSASSDQTVRVWGALDGTDVSIYTYGGNQVAMRAVAWSYDGASILAGGDDGSVLFWNESNSVSTSTLPGYSGNVNTLAWAPPTGTAALPEAFATGSSDENVLISVLGSDNATTLKYQLGSINSVAYSPDGWYLASGAADATVVIWDTHTSKRSYAVYRGHSGAVIAVVWLPNGVYIASASRDKSVQIWDATSGTTLLTYHGHTAAVNAVTVSPDGSYIASASDDRTVQVWNSYDGSTVMTYTGHTAPVVCVSWSPDGNYIASGSADKTARVWRAPAPPPL